VLRNGIPPVGETCRRIGVPAGRRNSFLFRLGRYHALIVVGRKTPTTPPLHRSTAVTPLRRHADPFPLCPS
jgi:hypothetical protein